MTIDNETYRNGSNQNSDDGMNIEQLLRGLCFPSDNKMEEWQQERIIEVVRACFE